MPLNVRSIAIGIAVAFFFGASLIGSLSGLTPFTCCKRALLTAALAYMAAALAVKAINAILMHAMITERMNQEEEKGSDSTD